MNRFDNMFEEARRGAPKRIAVAAAADGDVLRAIWQARQQGIAHSALVGDAAAIKRLAGPVGMDLDAFEVVDEPDPARAAHAAAAMVSAGEADVLMKGLVSSPDFLRAVLDADTGLRKPGGVIGAIAVFDVPMLNRFLILTDAGFIPAPTLEQKAGLIRNAVTVAQKLGVKLPKVGVLCASETVNPKIQSTVDAARLAEMNALGEIEGCIVDGPISLDLAISAQSALHKGYQSPVAGCADILIMPSLETGNALYKSMIYFANLTAGGVMAGAAAPIVFTSRADTAEVKLNTIALSVLLA